MDNKIVNIKVGDLALTADLNESRTARVIWDALPLKAGVNTWGDEIYFSIPVHLDAENPQELVNKGDMGFWPPGNALCLFFGPTPMSEGQEIRPASPVNVFGKIIGDSSVLRRVKLGSVMSIEKRA
jgi:uncharacterized protein